MLQDVHVEFEYYYSNCLHDTLNLIFEQNNPSKVARCVDNLLQLLLCDERPLSNRFVAASGDRLSIPEPCFSRPIQSIIWSSIDHFSRLLSENSVDGNLILQIFFHLRCYQTLPAYEQILQLACAFTDAQMIIIENDEEKLIDNLLLWRDALLNFIHFNNHDFHLTTIITLLDFLVPKLSVSPSDGGKNRYAIYCSSL